MMASKHTPGPWSVSEDDGSAALFIYSPDEVYAVARVSSSVITERNRSDARLIADAPAMLAILIEFVEQYDDNNPLRTGDMHFQACKCIRCVRDRAAAAIARATGAA